MSGERKPGNDGGALRLDIPEGVRQVAAAGVEQMKGEFVKFSTNAETLVDAMEKSCSGAFLDATGLHARLMEAWRANAMATVEFAMAMAGARTMPDVIEIYARFAGRQIEAWAIPCKDAWALGRKMMSDPANPAAALGFSRSINQAASS